MISKLPDTIKSWKNKYKEILFIALLIVVSFIYNYQEIAFKRPQSIHKWRQSDCASIALNYYQGGMSFFNSQTHNLTSDGGTTGLCATSELPILYYAVACLYKVFGYHDYIFRIFNTLIFFLGLFFLFKIFYYLLKDTYWSITLTLLFFTSPVLVYYGNNFLSNSSSLAFSIIGWYYFIRYIFESKSKYFNISMVIFLVAAALKITSLFSVFAIGGICILELLGINLFTGNDKLFKQPTRNLISISIIILLIGSWIVYAHSFNQKHACTYFSTTIFPIWSLDKAGIYDVLNSIMKVWLSQYFHLSVLLFLMGCLLFILFRSKGKSKVFLYSILIVFTEVIGYFILQFWTFRDHDYYTIDIYILPILIVIATFYLLKNHHEKIFNSFIFKVIFGGFLLFNIYYAHQKIDERYSQPMNDFKDIKDIYTITPYLRQIGITPNDTVISIPDRSHVTLYLMNQKGWTQYLDAKFNKGTEPMKRYNSDSIGIQESIDKGAKYLIINGIKELYTKPYFQSFCSHLSGYYGNVLIFDLRNNSSNFNLKERQIKQSYKCDAESISKDGQYFITGNDSTLFQNGISRSEDFAHNGKSSSKLNVKVPYGMTISFKDLKNGESFYVTVWRKNSDKVKGELIASSNQYYNSDYTILEKDQNGWEKIGKELFITDEMIGNELGLYLYNPAEEPVYFDDLEIIRYESVLNKQ